MRFGLGYDDPRVGSVSFSRYRFLVRFYKTYMCYGSVLNFAPYKTVQIKIHHLVAGSVSIFKNDQ